jgi:hypothetical protein
MCVNKKSYLQTDNYSVAEQEIVTVTWREISDTKRTYRCQEVKKTGQLSGTKKKARFLISYTHF